MEGSRRWQLFDPPSSAPLPSALTLEELSQPLLDEVLHQGDMLYVPRGLVSFPVDGAEGSVHLSLSTHHRQSWADLLLDYLPQAISRGAAEDLTFRQGLPLGWTQWFGHVYGGGQTSPSPSQTTAAVDMYLPASDERALVEGERGARALEFKQHLRSLVLKAVDEYLDLNDVADQHAVDFVALRTQPTPRQVEGTYGPDPRQYPACEFRLRNPSWVRVVQEGGAVTLFHCLSNTPTEHMSTDDPLLRTPGCLELGEDVRAQGLREMFTSWPDHWLQVLDLGRGAVEQLWQAGVVETRLPQ